MIKAATLLLLTAAGAFGQEAPNIVFFMVDDMGWMDSTPYGSTYYETPAMERFASQSMRFTDAYALPLCSPTRASILSGQHAGRHGVTGGAGHLETPAGGFQPFPDSAPEFLPLRLPNSRTFLDPEPYTLAEALLDAGYSTGHFGKWHLGKPVIFMRLCLQCVRIALWQGTTAESKRRRVHRPVEHWVRPPAQRARAEGPCLTPLRRDSDVLEVQSHEYDGVRTQNTGPNNRASRSRGTRSPARFPRAVTSRPTG